MFKAKKKPLFKSDNDVINHILKLDNEPCFVDFDHKLKQKLEFGCNRTLSATIVY